MQTYGRGHPLAKPSLPGFFPARCAGFLATAALQKTRALGSYADAATLRVRGSGRAHERSAIAGEWVPATG